VVQPDHERRVTRTRSRPGYTALRTIPDSMNTYGIPVDALAAIAAVHIDTARRWKRNGKLPVPVNRAVKLLYLGELGALDPAWRDFRLQGAELWTPEGLHVTPGEVRAVHWYRQVAEELRREIQRPRQWDLFAAPALIGRSST